MNRMRRFAQRAALATRGRGKPRRGALVGGILVAIALVSGVWLASNAATNALGFGAPTNPATLPTPPAAGQGAPADNQSDAPQPPAVDDAREAAPAAPAEGRGPKDRPAPEGRGPDRDGPSAGPRHEHRHDGPPAPQPVPGTAPMSVAPGAWWGAMAAPFAWIGSALSMINTAATVLFGVLCLGVGAMMLRPRGSSGTSGTSEPPRD